MQTSWVACNKHKYVPVSDFWSSPGGSPNNVSDISPQQEKENLNGTWGEMLSQNSSMIHPFRRLTKVIRGEESHSICVLVFFFATLSLERAGGLKQQYQSGWPLSIDMQFSPTRFIQSKRTRWFWKVNGVRRRTKRIVIIILDDNVNFLKAQNVWQSESLRVGRVGKLQNMQWFDSITSRVT